MPGANIEMACFSSDMTGSNFKERTSLYILGSLSLREELDEIQKLHLEHP